MLRNIFASLFFLHPFSLFFVYSCGESAGSKVTGRGVIHSDVGLSLYVTLVEFGTGYSLSTLAKRIKSDFDKLYLSFYFLYQEFTLLIFVEFQLENLQSFRNSSSNSL